MKEKSIPKVLVLGPITPVDDGDSLHYEKLKPALHKHEPYENERFRLFLDTKDVIAFLLQGKFDPYNERHISYIEGLNP